MRNTANSLPTPGTPGEDELVTLLLPPAPRYLRPQHRSTGGTVGKVVLPEPRDRRLRTEGFGTD